MKNRRHLLALLSLLVVFLTTACYLILTPRGPIVFDPPSLSDAQVGVPYDVALTVSGNATPVIHYVVSEGALPAGLKLEHEEGQDTAHIRGTPSAAGKYTFTVYIYCYGTNVSGQEAEKDYSITVQ